MVYLYILRITLSVVVSCCFFSILRTYCILYHELQVRYKGLVIFVGDDNA